MLATPHRVSRVATSSTTFSFHAADYFPRDHSRLGQFPDGLLKNLWELMLQDFLSPNQQRGSTEEKIATYTEPKAHVSTLDCFQYYQLSVN